MNEGPIASPRAASTGLAALLALATPVVAAADSEPPATDAAAREHFETTVAPLLARHCLECHNPSESKGDLDLTRREGALAAVTPGRPEESDLWHQVAEDEMPKKRPPLSGDEKAVLREWIASGAGWGPGPIDPFLVSTDRRAGNDWWSLQPVADPSPPEVRDTAWPRGAIDRFVLAGLEARGLAPAPEADRRTLIRRLAFDLTGLPPTPEEVEAFVTDDRPDAWERLVDGFLDSPRYGERWARHWLDVIRFGETQGFERNRIRPNAWRFRDWVVDALNQDLPYDEFVRLQVAGDVLRPDDLASVLATGFLVCGTWDQVGHLEGSPAMQRVAREDHVEDLVAAVSQPILGLTVNCARCHDHKFDPISQADYFRFAALLRGVHQEENERSGLALDAPVDARRRALVREIADERLALRREFAPAGPATAVDGLLGSWVLDGSGGDPTRTGPAMAPGDPAPWVTPEPPEMLARRVNETGAVTLEAWITPDDVDQSGPARVVTYSRDSGARNLTLGHDGRRWIIRFRTDRSDPNGLPALEGGTVQRAPTHVVFACDADGRARLVVDGKVVARRDDAGRPGGWDPGFRLAFGDEVSGERPWRGTIHAVALFDRALDGETIRRHRTLVDGGLGPLASFEAVRDRIPPGRLARLEALEAERAAVVAAMPPGHRDFEGVAHVVAPRQPEPARVLARGDVTRPGEVVAPAALPAVRGPGADLGLAPDAPEGERRARLATWLTDPTNPLTARVLVNRVWFHHFGEGIVDTPSDFGFNGGVPSHPELLDHLARTFMAGGWRLKPLHRAIVTSSTYRQASRVRNEAAAAIDADARLLWRRVPRRLDGESVRDAMLAVSGALEGRIGGPSFRDVDVQREGNNDVFFDPTNEFSPVVNRRTLYRLWARSGNHPMLEALDCPDPSVMAPRRTRTITPVQALALLNGSFVEQCAARLADRARRESGPALAAQVDRLHRLAFGRNATPDEVALAEPFVEEFGLDQFAIVILNTNEFLFVE